jgi:hypothetical protein
MTAITRFLMASLWLAAFSLANAEVVRVEITQRADVGATGYEQIVGRLHFEIDPAHPRNRIIADADLAPTNAAGRAAFSAELRIRKPKAAGRGKGAAWLARVTETLPQLIKQGCLQAEDLEPLQKQAAVRWDWVTKNNRIMFTRP